MKHSAQAAECQAGPGWGGEEGSCPFSPRQHSDDRQMRGLSRGVGVVEDEEVVAAAVTKINV